MINKRIYYCWFGKNKKSQKIEQCILSWKRMCPDYEIIEINEDNFDIDALPYTKEAYQRKKWAFVSDVARLWCIYTFGGIYLDTDIELIKPLDSLLENEGFFSFEGRYINTGLGFGATKGNRIVRRMLDDYSGIHFTEHSKDDLTPCPQRNTISIKKILPSLERRHPYATDSGILFLDECFFNPYDPLHKELKLSKETIGIHWYNGSWMPPAKKIKNRLANSVRHAIRKASKAHNPVLLPKEGNKKAH